MPELPDVEALRAAVERECLGRRLVRLELKEQGGGPREGQYDELVFDQVAEGDVKRAMEGKTLTGAFRKGKQMWVVLAEEEGAGAGAGSKKKQPPKKGGKGGGGGQGGQQQQQHVLLHMGMTGSLVVKGKEVPQYKSFSVSADAWPPKFCKAEFVFDGGVHLAYCDPRRWGRITLKADAEAEPPVSGLAPDAWKELPSLAAFKEVMQGCGLPAKALLLDQNKLVSGVGNWVADEIFYQARVDPAKRCSALRDDEIEAIRAQTFAVCDTACRASADADGFPADWLFHHRWANKAKGVKMPNGAAIVFETIGGRTTAIVPSVQRARGGGGGGGKKQAVAVKKEEEEEAVPAKAAGGRKRKAPPTAAAAVKKETEGKGKGKKRGKAAAAVKGGVKVEPPTKRASTRAGKGKGKEKGK